MATSSGIELAVINQWMYERLRAAHDPSREVFASYVPREQAEPCILFVMLTGQDMLVQERQRIYVDFEFDVFAVAARDDRVFPHEDAARIDQAINTGNAENYNGTWLGVQITWQVTCDRMLLQSPDVSDDAGDYRMSGGRYRIRLERVS